MIKVSLIKNSSDVIGLEVKGHAKTAEHGKDLLCAAVSAILTGGFNTFKDDQIKKIELNEGYAFVETIGDEESKIILKTMITQLEALEAAYQKNIKIK